MGELVIFIMGKNFFQLKSFKLGTQDGQTKTFIEKKVGGEGVLRFGGLSPPALPPNCSHVSATCHKLGKRKRPTALCIPRRSPIQVLTQLNLA